MIIKKYILILPFVLICINDSYCWSYNPLCWLGECCNKDDIPGDLNKMRNVLREHIYGQPLVEIVINAITAHWNPKYLAPKALTFSFHGSSGTGKNYLAALIANTLYRKGIKSKFVHDFTGGLHFSQTDMVQKYKEDLQTWLIGNISLCAKQLFIFDKVDTIPSVVLDGIKPMINFYNNFLKIDYRRAIFIFISHTGTNLINKHYEKLWNSGKQSKNLFLLEDFDLLRQKGFDEKDNPISSLIDYYIPFLPIQEEDVIKCIEHEFRQRGVHSPNPVHIKEILDSLEWTHSKLYVKTGCKRLSHKVMFVIAKHYQNDIKNEL